MTISRTEHALGSFTAEVITDGADFVGLGAITIAGTVVRSARLPLAPFFQDYGTGVELERLELLGIDTSPAALRIRTRAHFRALQIKPMRDHSLDPIHDLGDWTRDASSPAASAPAELDLVLAPVAEDFADAQWTGFSYHYEYRSDSVALWWLMDRASWELGGDIVGATVYDQSSCSSPVTTFAPDTAWTSEGFLFWLEKSSHFNRCMTHNLPRWAGHQCFDYQRKGEVVLIGVFERLGLIRTVLRREPGNAELKCFDKHIFDETRAAATVPKRIMLTRGVKTTTQAQNLWTWAFDECHRRARAEVGLPEKDPIPTLGYHHWKNLTVDTYYKDILPACAAVGIRQIFTDNFKRSDMTEPNRLIMGNMCCAHELEIAEAVGGAEKLRDYIDRCHALGIKNLMWTSSFQSYQSGLNRDPKKVAEWYVLSDDTRTRLNGAYCHVGMTLDLKVREARDYWVTAHRKICEETRLDGYFIDSFYNLMFMPVSYRGGHPRTMWREALQAIKELADEGVEFAVESFGPFGQNLHGHPSSYGPACAFICYHIGYGNDYVTIPVPGVGSDLNTNHDPAFIFHALAHKIPIGVPLHIAGKRIDEVYGAEHRRVLALYHALLPRMRRRFLQEDGNSVLWHDDDGVRTTVWNFVPRTVRVEGKVRDLDTQMELPGSGFFRLDARRCYEIVGGPVAPVALHDV